MVVAIRLVGPALFVALLARGLALAAAGLVAGMARALLLVLAAGVRRSGLGQLVRQVTGVAFLLAAMRFGCALVDRVPALDLVAVDVDVVVERVEVGERRVVRELDRLVH